MKAYTPQAIYIDNRSRTHALTKRIISLFPDVPRYSISNTHAFIKDFFKKPQAISEGKKSFFLTINKGSFLDACPGTKNYLCCGYQILHPSSQCSLDCSYCILQAYFNNPLITFFTNTHTLFTELKKKVSQTPARLWRIGTGEFTDSLAFDHITGLSSQLIPYFIKTPNAVLELKTKTTNIDALLSWNPHGKVITAWSLNSPAVIRTEERGAASIPARLKAAKQCAAHGYKLAFHFDPIIHYQGWEKDYASTIAALFRSIKPHNIAWISLGCFRFIPTLKDIIEKRFPHSRIPYHEFIKGLDGKMRYPKPQRIAIYRTMKELIASYNSSIFIYLCMESSYVWKESFGYTPQEMGGLAHALDRQVFPHIS